MVPSARLLTSLQWNNKAPNWSEFATVTLIPPQAIGGLDEYKAFRGIPVALEGDSACLGLGGWLLIGTAGKELGFGRPALNGRIVWQGLLFSQRVQLCTLCLHSLPDVPSPSLKLHARMGRTADYNPCPPLPQPPCPWIFWSHTILLVISFCSQGCPGLFSFSTWAMTEPIFMFQSNKEQQVFLRYLVRWRGRECGRWRPRFKGCPEPGFVLCKIRTIKIIFKEDSEKISHRKPYLNMNLKNLKNY